MALNLILSDGTTDIYFIGVGTYELLDSTFEARPPDDEDTFREISFSYRVNGTYQQGVMDNINAVNKMLDTARKRYKLGTGDPVVVKIGFENPNTYSVTLENGQTGSHGVSVSFNVQSGTQEFINPFSLTGFEDAGGNNRIATEVNLRLQCDPYGMEISRQASNWSAGYFATVSPENTSQYNRAFPGTTIEGDVPALTRIHTKMTGATGIIIARDEITSVINAPTVPTTESGTSPAPIILGVNSSHTAADYLIDISATGTNDSFRYSTNGGSSWSGNTTIYAHKELDLPGDLSIMFFKETGHTLGDQWSFRTHQAPIAVDASTTIGNNNNVYDESGVSVGSFHINVPSGCYAKYKVIAYMGQKESSVYTNRFSEISMLVYDQLITDTGAENYGPVRYDWVSMYYSRGMVDLGTIDLTQQIGSARSHQDFNTIKFIQVYARATEAVASDYLIDLTDVYLIPCTYEHSYIWTAWKSDATDGREVISNYTDIPYIAEISANWWDTQAGESIYPTPAQVDIDEGISVSLDETHEGQPIKLHPGTSANTVLFVPLFTSFGVNDYRNSVPTGSTGNVIIAYRPSYKYL